MILPSRILSFCVASLLLAAACVHLSAQAPARTTSLIPGKSVATALPRVILSAGHRNNDSTGATGEPKLTRVYANAYAERLALEGFKVHYIQRLDDARDRDPDWYAGGLSKVAQMAASLAQSFDPAERIVMLDVHMEGPSGNAGVFAIIPDGAGLKSYRSNHPDTWEDNRRSLELGRLISTRISQATGISIRRARERGVMSEKETDVALSRESRLAMFAQTSMVRERMERLIVEHGNLKMDARRLHDPATPRQVAGAVADALRTFYGVPPRQPGSAGPIASSPAPRPVPAPPAVTSPPPRPGPPPAVTTRPGSQPALPAPSAPAGGYAARIAPPPLDGLDHRVNHVDFVAARRRVTIARDGVPGLRFATPASAPVRAPFRAGEVVEVAFFVRAAPFEGDTRWWVAVDGTRIPMAGTVQKLRVE